jgi:hypothetical protein
MFETIKIQEILLFIGFGLGQEIVITGLFYGRKDKMLMGYSSVWYVPIYASAPFVFELIFRYVDNFNFFIRGLIYGLIFLILEFVYMGLLRLLLGRSPSEDVYKKSKWNILGLTRLDHYPLYVVSGLIFEWLYLFLRN